MRLVNTLTVAAAAAVASASTISATMASGSRRAASAHGLARRDASTVMSGGNNSEGEAHGEIRAPRGSDFVSLPVGRGGETIAAYWTANPKNESASQVFITIHGRLRDGDDYWETMDDILNAAVRDDVQGADRDAIVVAPQFFSERYNSGQYDNDMLAWGDVNAWQAGDPALHPSGTKLNSMDALDALVDEFQDRSKYPAMKNITLVGHGGGAQLMQRYAAVGHDPQGGVHVRYIHGDPSSGVYFTNDRPSSVDGVDMPSKSSCEWYNTWRYGFDNFTGTAEGLKTPQEYFKRYITRDVVSIVGYDDTKASGDQYCMALMQGGEKRRDRNLAWWQYINTLARTTEDISGFPAKFGDLPDWSDISQNVISTRLVVVQDAGHDAEDVFASTEGRAVLFSHGDLPTGWRPQGWKPAAPVSRAQQQRGSNNNDASNKGTNAAHDAQSSHAVRSARSAVGMLVASAAAAFVALHL